MSPNQEQPLVTRESAVGSDARLSWLLAGVAGMIGAVAFLRSAGYFVTFMTGNTERAIVTWFSASHEQNIAGASAVAAIILISAFVSGVSVASFCRRRFWQNHPHGPTVLTTVCLLLAAGLDFTYEGFSDPEVRFIPIVMVTFSIGALNTSFVKNGEVSVPLSYVTGTLVKLGQGVERHALGGGTRYDWLGYAGLYSGFSIGAAVGSIVASHSTGPQTILAAGLLCGTTTLVTFLHSDRKAVLG
ncbi:YoaK family protein [Rhodococcus qingshengii]|uniref:YoaK family protein n=1 Tax=Rhodococcus qingshengii TaxID=334542 RepID=A0AAW6LWS7_RHOSG|nr:YoaK family protein [Rhodococcus qingshengii]MDE8649671.1 YoaK family protein [Rhodococcus qingshengii]